MAALSHDFPKEATSFIERAANSKIEQLFIGPDQIGVKISSKGSVLANVVRVEHILAVKNDVFPFDGADMLQETDVDIFAFRNAHFQNAGDFLSLPIDDTGQQ